MNTSSELRHYYTVCLDLSGKLCVVVGGGNVARRKIETLLESEAAVRVISPQVSSELKRWTAQGKIEALIEPYATAHLEGAFLVVAATADRAVNQQVTDDARDRNLLLNVVDAPEDSNFIVPAMLRRGPLTIAISTGGGAPGFARRLRQQIERTFGEEYGQALFLFSAARQRILAQPRALQPQLWEALFDLELPQIIQTTGLEAAQHLLQGWLEEHCLPLPDEPNS